MIKKIMESTKAGRDLRGFCLDEHNHLMISQNALVGEPNTTTKFGNIQAKEPRIIKVLKISLVTEVTKY